MLTFVELIDNLKSYHEQKFHREFNHQRFKTIFSPSECSVDKECEEKESKSSIYEKSLRKDS
jgi:hypothetical protein